MAVDVIEHDPFAKREIAERDFVRVEPAKQRVHEHGASDGEIRAARVEPGQLEALLERQIGDLFPQPANALGRDAEIARLGRNVAAVDGRRDGPERQDRARRSDDAVVPGIDDALQVLADLVGDVCDHLALVASAQRIRRDEALGQTDGAKLEAPRKLGRWPTPRVISTLPPPTSMTTVAFGVSTP